MTRYAPRIDKKGESELASKPRKDNDVDEASELASKPPRHDVTKSRTRRSGNND